MNKREAKRLVCARVATALWHEMGNDCLGLMEDLEGQDAERVLTGLAELVRELTERAGLPPRPTRVEVDGQRSIFDELDLRPVTTVTTDVV